MTQLHIQKAKGKRQKAKVRTPLLPLFLLPFAFCLLPSTLLAQQPPPLVPNPQAPVLNAPAPLGATRGVPLELNLTGTNLAGPVAFWTSFPAKVTIPTEENNGKDNTKLKVKLEVPKDAPIGTGVIRLATTRGVSNLRLFCIDELPQVLEVDTNRNRSTPQAVTAPCVVVGKTDAEASDWYRISIKTAQRLSFEILGRRLGYPIDPQLTLYDAASGKELAGGHSNDAPGCQTDPRLTYNFTKPGDYLIEVRDVMYRGGADYWYRLRIGDFPCATTPLPLAVQRGVQTKVQFVGTAVDGVIAADVTAPSDPQINTLWVAPKRATGPAGWPVALAVSDFPETVEQEPNNEPAKANRLTVPGGVSGRFEKGGDADHFVFPAKKGQRLLIEGVTLDLYSPTLLYLVLRDAKGAEVAKSNPSAAPPADQRIDYTIATDGDYTVEVQHLNYSSGPTESYRLTVTPYQPGFTLSVTLDRFDVAPGAALAIPIQAVRRDYTGPIEVNVLASHSGITGKALIAQGQPAAANQPATTLYLAARPDVPPGPYTLTIQGKAKIGEQVITDAANVKAPLLTALGNLTYPPRDLLPRLAIGVTEKPAFTLAAKFDLPESLRGGPANLTITATRAAGFEDEIALTAVGLPANVTAALKPIPKGQKEAKVQLTPAATAALGTFPVSFTGKAKVGGKDLSVTSLPVDLVLALPFELKVEPASVAQGGKSKLKITATRKGGYQGPIGVEVKNLPANVTAAKGTIEKDKDTIEIELTAAANAAVGDKADVNVQGTATAAANQQQTSPNFTVKVVKP